MIRPHAFSFHNGRTARTAIDLLQIIEEGPEACFTDHVLTGAHPRNDFASWADTALREPTLAARLREATTREQTLTALRHWLSPHAAHKEISKHNQRTDFMIGFATGLIVGILVMAVVAMLN